MKVKAIGPGYYNEQRIKLGQLFVVFERKGKVGKPKTDVERRIGHAVRHKGVLPVEDQISERWMIPVDEAGVKLFTKKFGEEWLTGFDSDRIEEAKEAEESELAASKPKRRSVKPKDVI